MLLLSEAANDVERRGKCGMLKLDWSPQKAGAPDAPGYAKAADRLANDVGGRMLQRFPKAATAPPVPNPKLAAALDGWLATRADTSAPVPVMVHGYQYDPTNYLGGGADDPYHLVYGVPGTAYGNNGTPLDYHKSWLPLVGECNDKGADLRDTALAFAWVSEGSLRDYAHACWPSDYPYAALDLAPLAAKALATVLGHLGTRSVTVRILAHSLGTRTFCQAIRLLEKAERPCSVDRAILMGGAEFCVDAAANFSGCKFDVINLASRVDKVLQFGAEAGCHPFRENGSAASAVIGREGLGANPRWLDLQLDDDHVVSWFRSGYAPTATHYLIDAEAEGTVHPMACLNHWAYYMNDGNRELVRDLVLDASMTVDHLVSAHVPRGVASAMYGHFNGLAIPPTPETCAGREVFTAGNDVGAEGAD